ncbi:MAG TPA: PspC domain-containing protein [Clostridia bacterium]|nr:PspC domain-containing protein [Clostridia bacterium]
MDKKLYRSREQKMLAGVCGGVGEYFNIDVTLVRLVWAIAAIPSFGGALVIYILAAIIVPERSQGDQEYTYVVHDEGEPRDNAKVMSILGIILVVIGAISLIGVMFPFAMRLLRNGFWPILLIVIGGAIVYSSWKRNR